MDWSQILLLWVGLMVGYLSFRWVMRKAFSTKHYCHKCHFILWTNDDYVGKIAVGNHNMHHHP